MRMHWVGRAAVVIAALLFTAACGTIYSQQGRGYPNYPSRGGVARGGGYVDAAYQRGLDDGYRRGLDAARHGSRRDPRRDSWYRSAERGYDRRYGSRSEYRQVYRDGFMRGYEQGYRDARYRRRP
ncbi:MAG TPA: hypothetical protein VMO26_21400 [Vicinamibacterales bacterium]|nr:hypothetical protein [Vicinamibacterales bacterium]